MTGFQHIFVQNFAKFEAKISKFKKKICAPAARNSGLPQIGGWEKRKKPCMTAAGSAGAVSAARNGERRREPEIAMCGHAI